MFISNKNCILYNIFVVMGKKLKHIYLVILAISLSIVIAEGNFLNLIFSDPSIRISLNSSDLPCNIDHLNTDTIDDEDFLNELKVHASIVFNFTHQFPKLNIEFNCHYYTCIWQPPKFS